MGVLRSHQGKGIGSEFAGRWDAAQKGTVASQVETRNQSTAGCRRLNRGVENTGIRLYFKAASRLGDGVIWYALMLALPFIYGDQGLKVALVMLATSAVASSSDSAPRRPWFTCSAETR